MIVNDTVFALSTPVGGAIAILRISGPNTRALVSSIFKGKIEHRRASFGTIEDENGRVVDTAQAVFFEAPHSYTGEDMAEIGFHGSFSAAQELLRLAGASGLARLAEPGEFTKRAYLNGKLDLAQAEAVMDLVSASAERSRRAAVLQLTGRLSSVIASLYEEVKLLTAELANEMDDDTGVSSLSIPDFSRRIGDICASVSSLYEGGLRFRVLREGARVAIIGSPNVGKSSLLNALILRERAIVTPIPGTTRDTLEESVSIDGIPAVLIDTAGIRESADEVERIGVGRSLSEVGAADLVLWVVDSSRELTDEDRAILGRIEGKPALAVLAKADIPAVVFPDDNGLFEGLTAVCVSSLTGEGLAALKGRIAEKLLPSEAGEPLVTNSRHVAALGQAADCLASAGELVPVDTDAAFFELRRAMDALASILGVDDPAEELVDSVFANFCLGK